MATLSVFARIVHVLLLGGWAGAAGLFWMLRRRVEVVLSSVHAVDAPMHAADALLRDVGGYLDGFGLIAGPLLLLTLLLGWAPLQVPLRNRAIGVVLTIVLSGVSAKYLSPRRAEIIGELGRRLDDVDRSAPRYLELVQLDQVALGLLLAHALLAVVLLAAAVRADRPRRRFGIEV